MSKPSPHDEAHVASVAPVEPPPDFGPGIDSNGLSGTEWLFAEEAAPLTTETEIESLVSLLFARFLGRDVLTVSFFDDSPRLLAIGSVESLPDVRAAESFLSEVRTSAFGTGARWALPMLFKSRPRRAAYLRPVDGRCWFRLDDLGSFRALLGGAWLAPVEEMMGLKEPELCLRFRSP